MLYRLQTSSDLRARSGELRILTSGSPTSDMNRLLDSLDSGEDPLIAASVAEDGDRAIGWAMCDTFEGEKKKYYVVGVFVLPSFRRQGVGSRLVTDLLEEVRRVCPEAQPLRVEEGPFWSRFPVQQVRLNDPAEWEE